MKKWLLCVISLLLIICLTSCAPKTTEPDMPPEGLTPAETPPVEEPAAEVPAVPGLTQVSIYHLGIKTVLDISEPQTLELAGRLIALLETAAETDSMDSSPADAANPIQVMAGQTALELIFAGGTELPIAADGEPLTAKMLLYSIPYIDSDGGLLYLGQDIYEETPVGKLFDEDLQNSIYNSAADQVERISFSDDGKTVAINGVEYAFERGEDAADLPDMLVSRMLYRGIAFYLNAYTGNVNGLKLMSTSALNQAMNAVSAGQTTDNGLGEETIVNLNRYILADYFLPQIIFAPVKREDGYAVVLKLNDRVSTEIQFTLDEDMPMVSGLFLAVAEPAAE